MFYSHEVLTSRKYGVATVWLVATLGIGSKSSLKRVSRKAILDVDVSKACETIVMPEAPLALRLQSNLLYGVARVYSQQCGYVLNDAESACNSLRTMFKAMRSAELEQEGGNKGRLDQLVLPDDPNFIPDFDGMSVDWIHPDINTTTVMDDAQLFSISPHTSQYASASQPSLGDLMIPPSHSSLGGGLVGDFNLFDIRSDSEAGTRIRPVPALDYDPGFTIGDDGIVHMDGEPVQQLLAPSIRADRLDSASRGPPEDQRMPTVRLPPAVIITSTDEAQIEHPGNDDFVVLQDDDRVDYRQANGCQQLTKATGVQQETSSETAQAPQRRRKTRPLIPMDTATTLHNSDLARWNTGYLNDQREAAKRQQIAQSKILAKQNAECWVLGSILGPCLRGPLDMFSGAKLLEAFTGINLLQTGQKRAREEESSDDRRRVRSRGTPSPAEIARGLPDDAPMVFDDTIEQGRHAPTPLDEHLSSAFPWNQSAGSRQASASIGGGGGARLSLLSGRGSRFVSASPLVGRGRGSGTEAGANNDIHAAGFSDFIVHGGEDAAFELYGSAAGVDTQVAEHSQRQRTTLLDESGNFLEFVRAAIAKAESAREHAPPDDDSLEQKGSVEFEDLLPPESNSHVVAAQALLHVLTLGTKNLLEAQQNESFGAITLSLIDI